MLNRKLEFNSNEIYRLAPKLDQFDSEKEYLREQGEKKLFDQKMSNFIQVIVGWLKKVIKRKIGKKKKLILVAENRKKI